MQLERKYGMLRECARLLVGRPGQPEGQRADDSPRVDRLLRASGACVETFMLVDLIREQAAMRAIESAAGDVTDVARPRTPRPGPRHDPPIDPSEGTAS